MQDTIGKQILTIVLFICQTLDISIIMNTWEHHQDLLLPHLLYAISVLCDNLMFFILGSLLLVSYGSFAT